MNRGRARLGLLASCFGLAAATTACASSGASPGRVTLRLGHFPNITHATALVGLQKGIFAGALGPGVTLQTRSFAAGPAAVEALFAGALDAAYIGPSPAINAFVRSKGEAIRIVSGATSGGAFLVVRPAVSRAEDLRGKKIASPQLGNTQDVALRSWLVAKGLATDEHGGGDVSVVPQENAQTLETFRAGSIDGAWVPEPWATRLVLEAGGKVLVDERDLWPGGDYVATHLIVRTEFLRSNPGVVESLLRAQVEANAFVNEHPDEARRLANEAIAAITGKALPDEVIERAWANLRFTNDPIASSLRRSAQQAQALGLLPAADLGGIYDLAPLNAVLRAAGEKEIAAG